MIKPSTFINFREFNNKMKKVIILLLAILILVPASLAEIESIGPFKQHDCVKLPQTCSNCTFTNLSKIQYPDSTISIYNSVMTKDSSEFNYTFCNTSQIGNYIITTCSDVDGILTCVSYTLNITPTGGDRINSLGIFIILVIISIAILIIAMVFQNGYIGFISGCLFLVTGVYTMIYGLGNLSDTWTRAVAYVILGIGLIFCVSAGIQIIGDTGFGIGNRDDD